MEDPRRPDPDDQDQHDADATEDPSAAEEGAPGIGGTDAGEAAGDAPEPEEPG